MEQSGRNRWQSEEAQKRLKQAKSVVIACRGKEGVDGSSPSEGFREAPAQQLLLLSVEGKCRSGGVHETSTAPNVNELAILQPL